MPESRYTTPEEIEAMRRVLNRATAGEGGADRAREQRSPFKIAGTVLFGTIILLLLVGLLAILLAKQRGEVPGVLGFHLFIVESGSMEPTLPVGSVILSRRPADAGELPVNAIVTFKTVSGELVTHRISDSLIDDDGKVNYRTKGDNPLNSPDSELLSPDRVVAVFLIQIPSPW